MRKYGVLGSFFYTVAQSFVNFMIGTPLVVSVISVARWTKNDVISIYLHCGAYVGKPLESPSRITGTRRFWKKRPRIAHYYSRERIGMVIVGVTMVLLFRRRTRFCEPLNTLLELCILFILFNNFIRNIKKK